MRLHLQHATNGGNAGDEVDIVDFRNSDHIGSNSRRSVALILILSDGDVVKINVFEDFCGCT